MSWCVQLESALNYPRARRDTLIILKSEIGLQLLYQSVVATW